MKIDPRGGRLRLAEAHCQRGSALQRAKKLDSAIADYERAMELGAPSDGCDCQPESPLAWLYLEKGQYDKSWEVVHRAQSSSRWITPELLDHINRTCGSAVDYLVKQAGVREETLERLRKDLLE